MMFNLGNAGAFDLDIVTLMSSVIRDTSSLIVLAGKSDVVANPHSSRSSYQ
jgi:hypothetical protein